MPCENTGQHGMRKRYNRNSDGRLEPSKFQLLMSQYETKIAQYVELKSKIELFSKEYDSELSRIHWRIREVGDKIDFEMPSRSVDTLPLSWTSDILTSIDKIVEYIGKAEKCVSDFFFDFPSLKGEYKELLNLLLTQYKFEFDLEDVSRAYQSLIKFKSLAIQVPAIENENDKAREYAALSRVAKFDKIATTHQMDFGSWIHDSRHYIDRLRSLVKSTQKGKVIVRTIHSIDALQCALYVLKRDFYYGQEPPSCTVHQPYEPYKLFHKFQYCFSEEFDSIDWRRSGDAEGARLRWVSGMETLVLNLYSNAAKYIPKDGHSHDVTTSFIRQQQGLLITVKSVGPYVPSAELEDIFKIGYRASTADIGSTSGSGRGLGRVKAVCDNAGYVVWANSERRAGLRPEWADFSVNIMIPENQIVA